MSLTSILILLGMGLLVFLLSLWTKTRFLRKPLLLVFSVGVIFWLQPALPIRGLDFWLPMSTLTLAGLGWALTAKAGEHSLKSILPQAALIAVTVLVIAFTRYLGVTGLMTPSRPPQTLRVLLVLLAGGALVALFYRFHRTSRTIPYTLGIAVILLLFICLKLPPLTQMLSGWLRSWSGQSRELVAALDLRWLGFSYIAFRLIHTLRDRQLGRLPSMALDEYFIYILFFPTISAGPIDRSERFLRDLRTEFKPDALVLGNSLQRLVIGLFKKFVLADLLAMIALNSTNALQLKSAGWTWLLVYAYAFQIYFDFSGYTDMAIGLGLLMGISLPENFNTPYLKPNLTQFWNNWHMTLTQWFRAYFFNPLTRAMRSAKKPVSVWLVILVTQLSTFFLIGLWHGMTLNFILWGLWHGLGLFLQNRWSDWTKPLSARIQAKPVLNRVVTGFTTLLTFQFVAMGWVWFALPSVESSLKVFARLFGAGG